MGGVSPARLDLSCQQILAFRRHAGALDERLPPGERSLRQAAWAGLQDSPRSGTAAFEALRAALTPVRTPIGEAWILTADEETLRTAAGPGATARLLPSGDAYFLLQGADRELLVPEAGHRGELWPTRVWP